MNPDGISKPDWREVRWNAPKTVDSLCAAASDAYRRKLVATRAFDAHVAANPDDVATREQLRAECVRSDVDYAQTQRAYRAEVAEATERTSARAFYAAIQRTMLELEASVARSF